MSAAYGSIATVIGRWRLRRAGRVDGVLQVGTSYRVRHDNLVSFEDMTIPQAMLSEQTNWHLMTFPQYRRRASRQRAVYRTVSGAAFTTSWASTSAVQECGLDPRRAYEVGIGVNFPGVPAEDRDWTVPKFLFLARVWETKGVPTVVEAFRKIREKHPKSELHLVGGHPEITEPGVYGHGPVSISDPESARTVSRIWSTVTCLVVPSVFEAAGIVFAEAKHAGVPSIGGNLGGASDVIGSAGLTVDPGDVDGLADAMLRMCDPDVAKKFATNALASAPEYTWTSVVSKIRDIYTDASGPR
ncbi:MULTISPECIES: glycosyltransferase family 4 protein [Arthrobacter]|uniref:Glycosyltransferase family 4 protein n=2 Tax=Arthrobacter TaxID=1663 RepID=A0ABU9KPC4_9MICC|nr:glycosyltransferase family 4 protein [Arthrobacter sp. YJM1]MDP5227729.1 glycosyltransferase family 4 protein [Arthrobacter sp. YJM1]